MEIQIGWYIPHKVIYFAYPEKLTVDILSEILDRVTEMINEVDHPIYVISNSIHIESYPISVNQVTSVVKLIRHPNYIAININKNRAITFMSSFIPRMLGSKIQVKDVGSVEEAIEYIKSKDSSIDWSLANTDLTDKEAPNA